MYYTITIEDNVCFISYKKAVDYLIRNYYNEFIETTDDIKDFIERKDYEDLTRKQQEFLD